MPVGNPPELAPSLRSARIVAVIPARYQSTRLPGKPLADIDGRPMVQHVYACASQARLIDAVIVATDDERIAGAVRSFGGHAMMTRATHTTGTDRLAEVAAQLDCDLVVNVQGDEPLMIPDAIDAAVARLRDRPEERMSTLRTRIAPDEFASPAVVKVVIARDGSALYFSRAPVPYTRPGQPAPHVWKHMGLYVYRRDFLLTIASLPETPLERSEGLEQLRVLEHGFRIATVETRADSIGVDTPEDLERVRRLVAAPARF